MNQRTIALAAGGTAGHVYPAIAVASALQQRGWRVLFLGAQGGRETAIVPRHGFELVLLPGAPYQRSSALGRMRAVFTLPIAVLSASALLRRRSIDAVIGFGGYASVGPVLAARALGRWSALLEPNVELGMANRLLLPWVEQVFTHHDTEIPARAPRLRVGVPIRAEIATAAGIPRPPGETPVLLVLGDASLDSRVVEVVNALVARGIALRVLHQGPGPCRYAASVEAECVSELTDMARAYAEADLVICRAGASTLAELAACGRAALLVPLRAAAEDHQTRNAARWQREAAALVLAESAWTCDGVVGQLADLLLDRERRERLSARARRLACPDATDALADAVVESLTLHHAGSARSGPLRCSQGRQS